MKRVLSIVGGVLVLLGGFWILQGINVIPIGFMAGHIQYAILGAIVVMAGVGLIIFGNRRRKALPTANGSAKDRPI